MGTSRITRSIWRRNIDEADLARYQCRSRRPSKPAAVEKGTAEGMLAAHALTTINCLVRKEKGNARAKRIVSAILKVFKIAAVDGAVIEEALQLPFSDFEDAVTAAAARLAGCDYLVTRDPKGFRESPVRALAPEAVTPLL
jgi:predicted nucleic acid-binding protein